MTYTPLPAPQQVREMLELLLGRDIRLETGADMPSLNAPGGLTVGVFVVDPGGKLAALWVSDLSASAAIGASLGLVPPGQVAANLKYGISQLLVDNISEAINVAGSLLNAEGAPHVVLEEVYPPDGMLPADVASLVNAYVPRQDLTLDVAGYGGGTLSFVVP